MAIDKKLSAKFVTESTQKTKQYIKKKKKISAHSLAKFDKRQNKFLQKLCKINCSQADALYKSWFLSQRKLDLELKNKLDHRESNRAFCKVYKPLNDSILTATNYLSNDSAANLFSELNKEEKNERLIHDYMVNQRNVMKKVSESFPELKKFYLPLSKDTYYLTAKLSEIDRNFSIKSKIQDEALKYLKVDPKYLQYFSKNTSLAAFSRIPSNWGNRLTGLQTQKTIDELRSIDLNKISVCGDYLLKESIETGKQQMQKLKTEFPALTNAGDLPDFKVKALKAKPFMKRLRYGFDFQLDQNINIIPNGFQGGLNISYLLSSNSSFGIGLLEHNVFKGNLDKKITKRNELTLQSFFDTKIRSIVFGSIIYEKSYLLNQNFINKNISDQFLVGVKLKYGLGKIMGLQISILYNFFFDKYSPIKNPIVYKVGYNF